jgi:G:T/U-mismatch repair DNA glycosylase
MPTLRLGKKCTRTRAKQAVRAFHATPSTAAAAAVATDLSSTEGVCVDEDHPIGPFVHADSRVLICGTFPPVKKSIKFYYPNSNNDMWKVLGDIFFDNTGHFYTTVEAAKDGKEKRLPTSRVVRCLDEAKIRRFAASQPIGFFDVCARIRRTRGNSSDHNIETLERTDVFQHVLAHTSRCEAIITTGTLALTMLLDAFHMCGSFSTGTGSAVEVVVRNKVGNVKYNIPRVGGGLLWTPSTTALYPRPLWIYRAPSTSRALPLGLDVKIAHYKELLEKHL